MHNHTPFVTVGIIVRNEEKNIQNTLSHILQQDYPHERFEIVLVDGNSTDATREVAETFLEKGNIHFSIWNEALEPRDTKGNSFGHSFARNVVLDHMNKESKYLAWIDGDCRSDHTWLSSLVHVMESATDPMIAGAGGRRLVEQEGIGITKKELALNFYFTSKIMSLGNPAFAESSVRYMPSIAGYNSIYKADILQKYRYDTTYPFNTDDIEINYRLTQDGYIFLHAPHAKIWHRMDPSIFLFLKQMRNYGRGAMHVSKLHRKIVRLYIPISLLYLSGTFLTPLLLLIGGWATSLTIAGWSLVAILSCCVCIENMRLTRSLWSFIALLLVPLHPLMYGVGVVRGLLLK